MVVEVDAVRGYCQLDHSRTTDAATAVTLLGWVSTITMHLYNSRHDDKDGYCYYTYCVIQHPGQTL